MDYKPNTDIQDKALWNKAQERVGFKRHALAYAFVITGLWILWFFEGSNNNGNIPWPFWPTLGWGIGLFANFVNAYNLLPGSPFNVEREYENLKKTQKTA